MEPVELALHAHAAFIRVSARATLQLLDDDGFEGFQLLVSQCGGLKDGCFTDGLSVQIPAHLGNALGGQ